MKTIEQTKKINFLAKGALFAATIIWGSSFVVFKNILSDTPPSLALAVRFFLAFVLLSLIFFKSYKQLKPDILYKGAITGVILGLGYIIQTLGLDLTTPGKNAFITASYCVMVPFLFWIASGTKPDKFNIMAAFVCFVGIGLVSLKKDFSFGKGETLTLASGVLFAAYIVAVARFGKGKDVALFTIIQFFAAGIVCAINSAIFEKLPQTISTTSIISVLYLGIFATATALLLQNFGQKHTNPSSASIILSFEAVFGVAFSIMFYGERMAPQNTIGFILIFIAVIISETKLTFLVKPHTYLPSASRDIGWLIDNPLIHRGDFSPTAPENSLAAFARAAEKGYNIELDIQLTADFEIVVFHDSGLKRMCGVRRKIANVNYNELREYRLGGTDERIPTLKEVLELIDGRVGIVIELKVYTRYLALCEKLSKTVEGYNGKFSVHSFSPFAMRWVGKNRPEWTHGIVSMNFQRMGLIGLFGLWLTAIPFFDEIRPDYIFYYNNHLDTKLIRRSRLRGIRVLSWTVKTDGELSKASAFADNCLCEGSIVERADKRDKSA